MPALRQTSSTAVPSSASRRRNGQFEEERGKLKKIVADLSLDKAMLQDVIGRNVWSAPSLQVPLEAF
jgi:putative transposase